MDEEDDEVSPGVWRSDSTSSSGREGDESLEGSEFRARASTDSRLPPRPARARHPPDVAKAPPTVTRRMSVAMRGNNASTY